MNHFYDRTIRCSRPGKHQHSSGFTLPELLVASLVTSLVIAAAGFGLIQILQANQKSAIEQERQSELNRALNFMADEIKEASSVEVDSGDSSFLLKLIKTPTTEVPPEETTEVVYFVGTSSSWRGRVIFREELQPGENTRANALVDAIATINPTCTGTGDQSEVDDGLQVFVQDNSYVKLCLVGELDDSRTLQLETQAFTRGSPAPPVSP